MKNFVLSIGMMLLSFLGLMNIQVYGQEQAKASAQIAQKGKILIFGQNLNFNDPVELKKLEELSRYLKEQYGKSRQMTYLYDIKSYAMYFSSTNLSDVEPIVTTISQKFNFVKIKGMEEDEFATKYPKEMKKIKGQTTIVELPANVYFPDQPNLNSNKPKN